MCNLKDYENLKLLPPYRDTLERELDLWHRMYLPAGKTVLDIGAGCGESVRFYLLHGAERVIAVESDKKALEYLYENFKDSQRVKILPYQIDKIKIDVEGAERNMVVETHFPFQWKKGRLPTWPRGVSVWRLTENWGPLHRKIARKIFKR